MAITTRDGLVNAMGNASQIMLVNKATIANQAAAGWSSLWRATGTPGQGAIPSTAAICDRSLLGTLVYNNAGGGSSSYLSRLALAAGNANTLVQIHDRLAHMGGLSGVTTGAQTVGVDVSSLRGTRCASDCSDVQWWAEIYTDIGVTGQTCTVTYTHDDGTGPGLTGQTFTFTLGGASPANRASRLFPLVPSTAGHKIRSIQSVNIGTSTGTAGSWGITATKVLTDCQLQTANATQVMDWSQLGLPKVPTDACLMLVMLAGTTSTGTLIGNVQMSQG